MNNDQPYISELINRLLDRSDSWIEKPDGTKSTNPNSTRLIALEETRTLDDLGFVKELKSIIGSKKQDQTRAEAVHILSYITLNNKDLELTQYLIDLLESEKKINIKKEILSSVGKLRFGVEVNISPIKTFLDHRNLREYAIGALSNSTHPQAEDFLIYVLETCENHYDLIMANATLYKIGTKKSLPALKKQLFHKKDDVVGSALNAIIENGSKQELPLFIEFLEKGRHKSWAIEGIHLYGDESAIKPVIKRIKQILAKERAREMIGFRHKGWTDLIIGLDFLKKFKQNNPEIKVLYNWILKTRMDFLFKAEKEWIKNEDSKI